VGATRKAKLALALVAALLALGAAEVALRLVGFSYPNFYAPDPVRGWSLIPGAEGLWTAEGRAWVRINGNGERDSDHSIAKPEGVLRIALLGDSCTEALQVPLEQTFWKRMEPGLRRDARAAGWRDLEVLNFGVAGYGTAQELLTLRERVWRYSPDIIVLAFYSGNDVRNNYRPLEQDPARPYFVRASASGDQLALDDSFRTSSGYRLRRSLPARLFYSVLNHSRVLELAKRGKGTVDDWVGSAKARQKETGEALQELGLDNAVYSPPRDADWREAWRITEDLILEIQSEVAAHGARFGLLSLTTPMQVNPDAALRGRFMSRLGVTSLLYPDERLARLAAAHQVPFLALAPALQAVAERRHLFLHGFPNTQPGEGHWNTEGHAAAAAPTAAWIRQLLLPSRPTTPPGFKVVQRLTLRRQ
jgi:hypothetical protein